MLKRYWKFFVSSFILTCFFSYSYAQWTVFDFTTGGNLIDEPTSIKTAPLGYVWIGTKDAGVFSYDGNTTWTAYDNGSTTGFPNDYINAVNVVGSQVIVSTGYGGAGLYNSGTWTTVNASGGLAGNEVWGAAYDALGGNIWYATYSGLSRNNGSTWQTFNTGNSTGMPTNHLYCIAIDIQDNIWLGTSGSGLVKYNGTAWQSYTISNSSIPSNTVNKIAVNLDDHLWVCTSNGVALFNKNSTWTVYNSSNTPAITDNNIRDIAIDNLGNVFLATANGLVVKTSNGTWYNVNTSNSDLPENELTCVAYSSASGNVWVGTKSSGVAKASLTLLSVEESAFEEGLFNLYPNPVSEELTVSVGLKRVSGAVVVSIRNAYGAEVLNQEETPAYAGLLTKQISVSTLPAGVYAVRVEVEGQSIIKKIIKY